ncbi:MAG TPA: hypothetical protein VFZ77_20840 [Acidimicrobiales bacterium]
MTAPSPPPVPLVDVALTLGGRAVDLATRALVAGVVPQPRFGREGEAVATAAALEDAGADLVDASLPPRLLGPVARAGHVPVAARAGSVDEAMAAAGAGAAIVLVPAARAQVATALAAGGIDAALALVVDDLREVAAVRALAADQGLVLAVDASRWAGATAMAGEAAAIAGGCRLVRTADVRRSRRVAEVMAAILAARRPSALATGTGAEL